MSELELRPGRPEDDEARDAYVRAHPRGTFFHLSGWERVVRGVFGHRRRDLLAWQGDRLAGVLPLMQSPRLFGGSNLLSMPFAVYGGPVADDAAVEADLLGAARDLGRELGAGRVELRMREAPLVEDGPAPPGGLPELHPGSLYVTFERDLPEDPADVLARMPKKARAEARKARTRHGLQLASGVWFVDDLYRLFLRNKRQLGSPGMPASLFAALIDEFGTDCEVHLVRRGKDALAAVMTFAYGDTLLAYYSGTGEGVDRTFSASNFMYMALQEWAVERGFRRFDFGRSRRDSGAMSFKQRQGFEAAGLPYRYLPVRSKDLPSFTPSNPKLKPLLDTWKRLPLWMVQRMSTSLARYLP